MSYVAMQYAEMAEEGRFHRAQRAARNEAAQTLRRAEHAHGRTMALCVALLNELRLVDASNLIFNQQVQEKVSRVGGALIDRSSSFAPLWELTFDLRSIMRDVLAEHAARKAGVIEQLEAAKPISKRFFWRPWRRFGRLLDINFASAEAADTARRGAIQLARDAQLGDELNLRRLLAAQV